MNEIWICEDEAPVARVIADMTSDLLSDMRLPMTLRVLQSGSDFRAALCESAPDLVLMDLVMKDESGFDLSAALRAVSDSAEIAYVTGYGEKMPEAFPYKPLGFVEKPVTREKLSAVLSTFRSYFDMGSLTISSRNRVTTIYCRRILYLESSTRHLIAHLTSPEEDVTFGGKLDDVATRLNPDDFIRCHKSYLVRRAAIRAIDRANRSFTLVNGQSVRISRALWESALRLYMGE